MTTAVSQRQLILLGATSTGAGLSLVQLAMSQGVQVHILTPRPSDFAGVFPAGARLEAHAMHLESVKSTIERLTQSRDFGIATTNDKYVELAAQAAHAFGKPGPTPTAARICQSKVEQKLAYARHGIASPRFMLVDLNDLSRSREEWPEVCVVKPDRGSSSIGVKLCRGPREILAHLSQLRNELDTQVPQYRSPRAVIETYLSGAELCIELFDGAHVGTLRKHTRTGSDFLELGYSSSLGVSAAAHQAAIDLATRAAAACGLDWGPVHIDCVVEDDRVSVVEINPRIAGSFIAELVRDAYGFDLVASLLARCMGEPSVHQVSGQARPAIGFAGVEFFLEDEYVLPIDRAPEQHQCGPIKLRYGAQSVPVRKRRAYVYKSF